jgi:hypothetical protein
MSLSRLKFYRANIGPLLGWVLCSCTWISVNAQAQAMIPEVEGWSGYLMLGAAHTDVNSNTVVGNDLIDGGNDTITSIYSKPRSNSDGHLLAGGELKYTLPRKNQVFLGGSLEDRLTLDFATQLGWRKQTDIGTFQLGYLFSGIPVELWEDPYLTGEARSETDRDSNGVRFEWNKLAGTEFDLQIQARRSDVDNELSGNDPSLGCNLECRKLLDRNGDQYMARMSYTFSYPGGHFLRPQIALRREDRDGDAISRDAWSVQLTYSYMLQRLIVVTNAVYGQSSYDERNPLYDTRQDADTLGLDIAALYTLPVESKRWQVTGGAFWAESNSDIAFHDNELSQVFVGLIYNFGHYPMADFLRAKAAVGQ